MVCLTSVNNAFHARVIAARLGCEGMLTELRGAVDGLYPIGNVYVYVGEEDLADAQTLLMLDEVESVFDGTADGSEPEAHPQLWLVVGALVLLAFLALSRSF